MQGPNFSSILDMAVTDAEPPKPFPVGVYRALVKGLPRFDKSSRKGTEFVEFTLQPIEACDVGEDELAEYGGLGPDKTIRDTYYLTETSMFRLRKFLEDCGIEVEGRSFAEAINDTPNCELLITVGHELVNDRTFVRIKSTDKA